MYVVKRKKEKGKRYTFRASTSEFPLKKSARASQCSR